MRCYLGIDNGGTVTKASVYDMDGNELGRAIERTEVISTAPGIAERDMEKMKEVNYLVIKRALSAAGITGDDIAGISPCGHGKGLYLIGSDGKPLGNAILSSDNRAWRFPVEWKRTGVAAEAYKKTHQAVVPSQPVSILRYLKDYEPEKLKGVRYIFQCTDYVRYFLTGSAKAEITGFSGTNLMNLETKNWDRELLMLFGLADLYEALPPVIGSTDLAGYVNQETSEATGLKTGTPVFGGLFDIDACALAVGVADDSYIAMIAGTWSINEYVSQVPQDNVLMNSIFADGVNYLVEESSATSAGNLEWLLDKLFPEKKEQVENIYRYADEIVEKIDRTAPHPVFLPFLMASNAHPNGKGSFVGLTYSEGREEILLSVFEGIVFSHRYHIERLLKDKKSPVRAVRIAGGASNSRIWTQMFADVLGMDIERISVKETGTLGAAINTVAGLGDVSDITIAASRMMNVKDVFHPDSSKRKFYDRQYQRYLSVINALDSVWEDWDEE